MRKCSVEGCERKHYSKGFCELHYDRFKRNGDPLKLRNPESQNRPKVCSVEGCNEKHSGKGFCLKHYGSFKRHGDPLEVDRREKEIKVQQYCSIEGCNEVVMGHGYCQKHNVRLRLHGDPLFEDYKRHGKTKTPEFIIWGGMKRRCNAKTAANYYNYGGRGITVCDRWQNSFLNFLEDMGERPSEKHQIDRIDSNGNYEPSNCRWVEPAVNVQNRRSTKLNKESVLEIRALYENGEHNFGVLAEKYGVCKTSISLLVRRKTWKNI